MTAAFPKLATGSIVRVTAPGSRASNGEPLQIPAIVLGQYPEDGQVRLFCFHFEGQYLLHCPPDQIEVVMDADRALGAMTALTSPVAAFTPPHDPGTYATRDELNQLRGDVQRSTELCSRLLALVGDYALKTEVQELREQIAHKPIARAERLKADA